MESLAYDPFVAGGIAEFGRRLRTGETTCEAVTKACLNRIAALNPKLGAFVHVAENDAIKTACGLDHLLSSGTDLGPLMGVPVAVKDLFAVEGMPTRAGSDLPVADLIGAEGSFVKKLKRAGCVILGKTRTIEFAAGAQNVKHPTPWNPWDLVIHRTPGGSSSGSAVAKAAGLCGFAIGSDTGGSVRLPAAMCGIFGLKTSANVWPTDGIFPLCPAMDTIGILTGSARDASIIFQALVDTHPVATIVLDGLRLGIPSNYFFDDLDEDVQICMHKAIEELKAAGVHVTQMELPEVDENYPLFGKLVPADLLATLGQENLAKAKELIDPVAFDRLSAAVDLSAQGYIRLARRLRELHTIAAKQLEGLDGWITPTTPILPREVSSCASTEDAIAFNRLSLRNTRPGNMYGLCASSIPIQMYGAELPVGLQIHCRSNHDARLLSISMAVEECVGIPEMPDLTSLIG